MKTRNVSMNIPNGRQVLDCASPLALSMNLTLGMERGRLVRVSAGRARIRADEASALLAARGSWPGFASKLWRFGLSTLTTLLLFCLAAGHAAAAVRYVDVNSAGPAAPYTTWATAARGIQDAIDVAGVGDEVVVTNGVYQTGGRVVDGALTNRVAVTQLLILRSVNGPAATVIAGYQVLGTTNGDSAVRCVYLADGAELTGFTLTNGATRSYDGAFDVREQTGGGVWCISAGSVVSNCVLTSNSAISGGGAAGGTLHNCVLAGNSASMDGGGVFGSTLFNCTLNGNSASFGGGAADGWLYNCIVYFNQATVGANYSEATTFEYSCSKPLPRGPGNITDDPQMLSPTHLSSTSLCIGSGSLTFASGTDIDGEPWANPPAMGADQPGPTTGPLSLWIHANFTNVAIGYPVSFTALNTGPILQSV